MADVDDDEVDSLADFLVIYILSATRRILDSEVIAPITWKWTELLAPQD